jgi:amino acid adenylation domain-containing protein
LRLQLLIERQVARTPDATAVEFEDLRLSYLELNQRSNRLARLLRQRGVGPGVLVGICVERSLEMVVALLAVLKAGGAYVPLDPSSPTQRLSGMLEDAQVSLILSQEQQLSCLPAAAAEVILLDSTEAHCGDQLADDLEDVCRDSDLAYVIFTSGSTGRPKGAMNEHRAVCNRLLWMQETYGLTPDDRVLQKTPLGFDVSVWELFWPLISGARLVIARPDGHRDSSYLVSLIRSRAITTLHFVPSMLRLFFGTDGARQCKSIKRLICSGEALDVDLQNDCLQQLTLAELHNLYGPTEAAIDVCFWRCLADERVSTVPIGKPVANTQIHILDRYRQPVPMGVPGEIYIGGVQVGRGYINRETLTVEHFLADPFSLLAGARLYRTGDLGRQRRDGAVEFLGRLDDQVKLRGQRLELGEIESWLNRHPAIAQSAVRLWQQDHQNHFLVAYLVPRQQLPGKEQITAFLKERLPDYMVPTLFVELDALPLTPSGKLDRRALLPPPCRGDVEERLPPANDQQRLLHTLWAEALGHADFGITDNFFLVGGHSLAAARLSLLIGQRLGVGHQFPLSTIFRLPTIAEQENALLLVGEDAVRNRITFEPAFTPDHRPNLAVLQPEGDKAPLFVVHGYRGVVGHFIHLARALAPHRPVIGVQASEISDEMLPPASMETLADHYARQILAVRPEGVIHLVGCSVGGWYAYALAAALRQRGASIGLLAVFDTQATASIPFGLGAQLLLLHLVPRMKVHLARRFRPDGEQEQHTSLRRQWQALKILVKHYLPRYIPDSQYILSPVGIKAKDPVVAGMRTGGDPFLALVRHGYSPPRLPISVDVFAPASNLHLLRTLWLHYARGGVLFHPLFNDHDDFIRPELMPQLAAALEEALARVEGGATP